MKYLDILQLIKSGQNPQQVMMSVLEHQMGNTPMGKNLMNLAMKKDGKTLEQIARNLCAQRGMDFDSEFKAFREKIGY